MKTYREFLAFDSSNIVIETKVLTVVSFLLLVVLILV